MKSNFTFAQKTMTSCKHYYLKFDHNLYDSNGNLICKVYICPDCGKVEYRSF